MRSKTFLLLVLCVLSETLAQIQEPPSISNPIRHNTRDRKSNQPTEDGEHSDSEESPYQDDASNDDTLGVTNVHDISEESIVRLLAQSSVGSAIKIIKAPDLSQEKEQKMTDIFTTLVKSHDQLIQKLKDEIDEIDGSIAALGAIPVTILTEEELKLEEIYEAAMKILNRTRSDKSEGFAMLKEAADKGHAKSRAKIAWAQLLGSHAELKFDEAKKTFLELAEDGLPDAHMVSAQTLACIVFTD